MNKHRLRGTARQKSGLRISWIAFAGNLVLFAAKITVGIFSGSISVIVDAVNNILDSVSSAITVVGFKISGKEEDSAHPHGHGRIEYVSAFVISALIMATAIILGYTSITRIINPSEIESSPIFIAIIAISIIGKGLLAIFYFFENRKIHSQMLSASGRDSLSDMFATTITLLALIFAPMTNIPIDGIAGLLISAFILYLGGKTFFANLHLLIGQGADKKTLREIRKIVLEKESFRKIEELDFHDYGPENREVLIKVRLSRGATKYKIERDIEFVQQELLSHYAAEAVIYWPPKA